MGSLLPVSRAEQENEKKFLRWRLIAHLCTLVVSSVALFVDDPVTYLLALVAVLSEAAAWAFRRHAQALHERAERGRRHGTLDEALGPAASGLEAAQLQGEFSAKARRGEASWDDPRYWRTQGGGHAKGPALLRVNLQESAFWSWQLYRATARVALARLSGFVLVLLCILLAALLLGGGDGGQTFARVAAVVLAVFVSADELGVMLGYFGAGRVSRETVDRLAHIDMSDLRSALSVFVDYSVATATAAPIPTALYLRKHDEIERLWSTASIRIDPNQTTGTP